MKNLAGQLKGCRPEIKLSTAVRGPDPSDGRSKTILLYSLPRRRGIVHGDDVRIAKYQGHIIYVYQSINPVSVNRMFHTSRG